MKNTCVSLNLGLKNPKSNYCSLAAPRRVDLLGSSTASCTPVTREDHRITFWRHELRPNDQREGFRNVLVPRVAPRALDLTILLP